MCFPKDLAAFISFTRSIGISPNLLEAVEEINRQIVLSPKSKSGNKLTCSN